MQGLYIWHARKNNAFTLCLSSGATTHNARLNHSYKKEYNVKSNTFSPQLENL